MRKTIDPQLKIGQTHISNIKFDLSSRDEIPQLLLGLQVIYSNPVSPVVLPRKGKLTKTAQAIESSPEFQRLRHKHSAVESSINALENHGLYRCPDRGIDGFKRYAAFAILARNLQIVGAIEQKKRFRAIQLLKRAQGNGLHDQTIFQITKARETLPVQVSIEFRPAA